MRNYECLFIVNPNFDGDGISTVIEKVTGYVKEADAEVANIQHWGKRRLAYQIEKQQYGNYVLMYLTGDSPKITDLQRNLELDSAVLAYLTIRLDEMPEFDKVFIPEDDGEDDRRGGRSRGRDDGYKGRSRHSRDDDKEESDKEESDTDADADAKAETVAKGEKETEATDEKADADADEDVKDTDAADEKAEDADSDETEAAADEDKSDSDGDEEKKEEA